MAENEAMPMCPMAEMCKGMMAKPFSGMFLIMPGLVLIALGVLIIIEPKVLVWLVAALAILMGLMMMAAAIFMRRIFNRMMRG